MAQQSCSFPLPQGGTPQQQSGIPVSPSRRNDAVLQPHVPFTFPAIQSRAWSEDRCCRRGQRGGRTPKLPHGDTQLLHKVAPLSRGHGSPGDAAEVEQASAGSSLSTGRGSLSRAEASFGQTCAELDKLVLRKRPSPNPLIRAQLGRWQSSDDTSSARSTVLCCTALHGAFQRVINDKPKLGEEPKRLHRIPVSPAQRAAEQLPAQPNEPQKTTLNYSKSQSAQ